LGIRLSGCNGCGYAGRLGTMAAEHRLVSHAHPGHLAALALFHLAPELADGRLGFGVGQPVLPAVPSLQAT
jgi:hypothetical protein